MDNQYSMYETGDREPNVVEAARFANVLGETVENLLSHSKHRPSLIHHLGLNVSDLPAAFDFWSWFFGLLGCQLYQRFSNGFSYRLYQL